MSNSLFAPLTALGVMGLALGVALIDRPQASAAPTHAWPEAIEAGADHITPDELAKRSLADPGSPLLIDVRPLAEFNAFHLPGALRLDLPELLGERGERLFAENAGRPIVLCSNGMTHPAQAWVELTRRGHLDVRVLEDGLDGFVRDVLTPPSLRGATSAERAALELPAFRAASAAFLGKATPPQATPGQAAVPAPSALAHLASDPPALLRPTVVSSAWVARRAGAIVLLDAREKPEDFAAGHLPGALHVPTKAWRELRDGVPDQLLGREALALAVGQLGIDANTEVVAYGDEKLQDPAHVALALISLGHAKVAILEGGLSAWRAEGRALSTENPAPLAKLYTPTEVPGVAMAELPEVIAASEGKGARLLDVRPADAFRGDVSTEARAGHIPGALNRPYTSDVLKAAEGLYWRLLETLRQDYEALGLRKHEAVIVSCRSGHQAAQTYFTLRYLLGYEDVRWYDGSWKEWAARTELPVAIGEGKP